MKGTFQKLDARTMIVASDEAAEALSHIRDGAKFSANIRAARNPLQHNLFWKLCQLVAEAQDSTKEGVKRWLLGRLNFVRMIHLPDGTIEIAPMSIAWESMGQAKFAQFFRSAMPVIGDLMQVAPKDLMDRYESILHESERRYLERLLKHVDAPSISPDQTERADEAELAMVGRGRQ